MPAQLVMFIAVSIIALIVICLQVFRRYVFKAHSFSREDYKAMRQVQQMALGNNYRFNPDKLVERIGMIGMSEMKKQSVRTDVLKAIEESVANH